MVCVLLSLLIAGAAAWFAQRGYVLYYGDAQAHLNISRSLIDSRTPGYEEMGNVWLPLLHVICLPFVASNALWANGVAGSIPVAACFVFAGVCFYFAARVVYRDWIAAAVVAACFALNPNILYLASIPMTELVFFAGLALFLVCFVCFRRTANFTWAAVAIAASWMMSLTRYDGWFLIPFCALWVAAVAPKRRSRVFWALSVLACLAPAYWLAHNWYETGNALDFFNGPYSAKAIQGGRTYPGFHDWAVALAYYSKAGQLCAGWPLCLLGLAGVVCALQSGTMGANGFLFLTPLFYVWSMHSAGNPIFVPQLYPFGHYNTRYGLAVVVLAAFACGALTYSLPLAWRRYAVFIPLLAITPWLLHFSPDEWICWKESQRNSVQRRAWTNAAADFLAKRYVQGEGILTDLGDVTGIYARAGIPLKETLSIQNGAAWLAQSVRPDLCPEEMWAVAQSGGSLAQVLAGDRARRYQMVYNIQTPGAPDLLIYKRNIP